MMSKDAQNEDLELTPAAKAKFDELVAVLSQHRYGEQGPPRETTFAEIEQFGHQAGRMLGRAVDAQLARQHAEHFPAEEPCPTCGEKHPRKKTDHPLPLQTCDGVVHLDEPFFRCPPCQRDFFPSADPAGD